MRTMTSFVLAAVAVVTAAGSAGAQLPIPLSVEGRADAAFPVGNFGDGVKTGWSVGASAALGVAPGFGIYGGYSRAQFELENFDADVVDQGFSVGLTAAIPGAGRLSPWVGGGLVFHDLEVEDDIEGDSDMGFELGAGIAVPVAPGVRLTPGVGYRRYSTAIPGDPVGALEDDVDVQYVTAGIGLNIAF